MPWVDYMGYGLTGVFTLGLFYLILKEFKK